MNECKRVKPLLSLSVAGDLTSGDLGRVEKHLKRCSECLEEERKFSQVISAARIVRGVQYQLPTSVRQRIALEAAQRVVRRPWILWFPVPGFRVRYGLTAAAVACLAGLLMTLALRQQAPVPAGPGDVTRIEVVADRGVVRLAWSDGQRASYTVMKSDDPRAVGRGEVHVVKGNVWIDRQPDSSPVVFYRIE